MKRLIVFTMLAALLCLLWGCGIAGQAPQAPTEQPQQTTAEPPSTESPMISLPRQDIKAMWLSQFDLAPIYLDGTAQRPEQDFTARMSQVLDNVRAQGFNTLFLQVRPNGDSMYPSRFYPMSAYVTGTLGTPAQYDPVAIIIRLAHARNLAIHAWINPMRGMQDGALQQLSGDYPMARWYADMELRGKYIVEVNGTWYLNPAYQPVRALIQDGARELLENYNFDGLHMDDYFYPTAEPFFDQAAYAEYQAAGGALVLADFRRDALNQLVKELYRITHSTRPDRPFGISPAGNTEQVYHSQFADIVRWCAEPGYIDYICPQVYFGLEHGSHDFVTVCRTYQDMIQTDSVYLLVGMTFGKAYTQEDKWAGTGKDEWKSHQDVLARCLETTRALTRCRGVAVFCYQYFFDPVSGQSVPQTEAERENFLPVFSQITWP